MLLHLRLVTPEDLTRRVRDLLVEDDRVTNVTVLPGAAQDPPGDLVEADVARDASNQILDRLEEWGLANRGGVTAIEPSATPSRMADAAEKAAGDEPDDSVIWDEVVEQAEEAATPSITYYAFLALATALAGVALVTDSPVLVVGAMVVGPDFGPTSAICTGIALRKWRLVAHAAGLLLSGYALAILVVAALAAACRLTGAVTPDIVRADQPLTSFVWNPDGWALVVAVLAGTAGALATTTSKSSTLVGVFISVTTVPATGGLAVALATASWDRALHAGTQLGVNVAGILVAGTLVLVAQRLLVGRLGLRSTRIPR